MTEMAGKQSPHEVAAASYRQLKPIVLDNMALSSGALSGVYADLQAQILGTAPATSADVQQIKFKPEGLRPGEYQRMQQVVLLVFRQMNRGYEKIRANRQNPMFSLKTSPVSARVEMKRFAEDFKPQARVQVLDLVSIPDGNWLLSVGAREQLSEAFQFVDFVLSKTDKGHSILRELNHYPGTVARDLKLPRADRSLMGLSTLGDPRYFGLEDVLPDEFKRGSVTQKTGAPARAEEKGELGRNEPEAPRKPLKIPRPKGS